MKVKETTMNMVFKGIEDIGKEIKSSRKENEEFEKSEEEEKLKQLNEEVKTKYNGNYIDYAMDKSRYLILNEEKNITKQILMIFMVVTGIKSLFNNIHGGADTGKSYIFETTFDCYIPDGYIEYLNSSTEAAFINKCIEDPHYFDRIIIYFGDLGDKEKLAKMKPILDILKIVISEGMYNDSKNQPAKDERWKPIDIKVIGVVGAFLCTVFEDNEDQTNQIDSRTIFSTPALNNRKEKILFKRNIKTKNTKEYAYYKKTVKELESFKLYFEKMVNEYDQEKYQVINPFLMIFDEITKHRITDTREVENIDYMFTAYCFLNKNKCFQFEKITDNENLLFLIPKIEEVQKFINIIYSSVGLKPHERNLILKLKEELNSITEEEADKLYNEIEKDEIEPNDTYKELFSKYGLKSEYKYFFKSSDITSKFRNHKAIKDIENPPILMNNLAKRGFLGKLENSYKNVNVYFLNEDNIKNIEEEYCLSKKDLETGINFFHENLKENPLNPESKPLFNDKEMKIIQENYNETNLKDIKRYD